MAASRWTDRYQHYKIGLTDAKDLFVILFPEPQFSAFANGDRSSSFSRTISKAMNDPLHGAGILESRAPTGNVQTDV